MNFGLHAGFNKVLRFRQKARGRISKVLNARNSVHNVGFGASLALFFMETDLLDDAGLPKGSPSMRLCPGED